jgi:DNA-binding transcriptional MerR regulator
MAAGQLSIGEVLAQLQREFPDVTISKIRFLESQGLINPERTPSGYRKFSEEDLSALQWILAQQRDHFLPLRVIKERLEKGTHLQPPESPATLQPVPSDPAALQVLTGGAAGGRAPIAGQREPASGGPALAAVASTDFDHEPSPAPADDAGEPLGTPVEDLAFEPTGTTLSLDSTTVSMTIEELSTASGLTIAELRELESFRLLAASTDNRYDGQAMIVAQAAAGFREFGVEPRHLRMFLSSAEREAGLYEQAAMPVTQRRGPDVRHETRETLERLVQLGDRLRGAMLRETLADHLR